MFVTHCLFESRSQYSEKLERITAIDAFALGPELDQGVERSDTRCLLSADSDRDGLRY